MGATGDPELIAFIKKLIENGLKPDPALLYFYKLVKEKSYGFDDALVEIYSRFGRKLSDKEIKLLKENVLEVGI